MKLRSLCVCFAMMLLWVSACAPEPDTAPAPTAGTAQPAGEDMLSGTWTGDWGPSANDRNAVTLELTWNGTTLTGVVNPGENAVALSAASYDPATNTVMMEADAQNFRGEPIHYMITGTLEGNTITGSWGHDDVSGDFTIMKGAGN